MNNKEILLDALQSSDINRVKELIKIFIYNNDDKKSKFNIYDYLSKKMIYGREYANYIYHKDGYKYATNSFILIKLKEDYPEEYELKSVNKKDITEQQYPNADKLINDTLLSKNTFKVPLPDTDELDKQYLLNKKVNKNYIANVVIIDETKYVYNFDLFHKLVLFAKHIGASELIVNKDKNVIGVKTDKGEALLMSKMNDESTVILRID